ncbi:SDR family NAD(P)-dependent oxidoreductase [Actinopolymorpha singaporensis]|uniref:Short chain dehydrogenase n=1 Tax=Actinopolymorpha singaporensis TaxID=117157 RepID=A0A1H1YD85_9ACTN|nr:SDR family NAD(P)-dependent oxidoreductase [Actinopolymorpha singaporensis]SDT19372.1 short chain dehydrogenase [Actinopolymorpha singaporensis]
MRTLSEQVVVVAGASSGIGRATAAEFASAGARVVAAARGREGLDSLVEEHPGSVVGVPTDVADLSSVTAPTWR